MISSRVHKIYFLVQLKGIDTIEQGDRMRGKVLFIKRSDVTLPKGRYFISVLLGMEVYITQMMKLFATAPLQTLSKRCQ